jgi:hypothetical protein
MVFRERIRGVCGPKDGREGKKGVKNIVKHFLSHVENLLPAQCQVVIPTYRN